jgi:aminoglycoside phosphotransferase (APT) family kinase protein
MEFLDGRIFEDPGLPGVSAEERTQLWKAAVLTLAKFHSVDFRKVGLESFGRPNGFYDRQLATWKQICTVSSYQKIPAYWMIVSALTWLFVSQQSQAQAVDVDSNKPVGPVPHFEELLDHFANKNLQPRDRASLVHGDYKLDNMVFHKTEPRVIGILDWEMSTVGHPLSDLANILNGFYTISIRPGYLSSSSFNPGITPGIPTVQDIVSWYAGAAGWNPSPELNWAMAFSTFRSSAISQGIAARVARRQATSEQAMHYVDAFKPLGELAWTMVEKDKKEAGNRAKL